MQTSTTQQHVRLRKYNLTMYVYMCALLLKVYLGHDCYFDETMRQQKRALWNKSCNTKQYYINKSNTIAVIRTMTKNNLNNNT